MSAHVLLNLLNVLRKSDKMRGLPAFYRFFAMSLINSTLQEYECKILFIYIYDTKIILKSHFLCENGMVLPYACR